MLNGTKYIGIYGNSNPLYLSVYLLFWIFKKNSLYFFFKKDWTEISDD